MPTCAPLELLKTLTPVMAAMAAALVAVVGWMVKSLVSYLSWLFTRRQQRVDLMVALKSEIETNLTAEGTWADKEIKKDFLKKFDGPHGNKAGFIPYAASTNEPPILTELAKQFFLLPPHISGLVFKYVNLSQSLDAQIKDFRSETFSGIGRPRQRSIIAGTFDLAVETCNAGKQALDVLTSGRKKQLAWQWALPIAAGILAAAALLAAVSATPHVGRVLINRAVGWVSTCSPPTTPPAKAPATSP